METLKIWDSRNSVWPGKTVVATQLLGGRLQMGVAMGVVAGLGRYSTATFTRLSLGKQLASRIRSAEMPKRMERASSDSPAAMGVATQSGGVVAQLGRMPLLSGSNAAPGWVGVPLARGMAGRGVLVGVAFRLLMAMAMGDGKICRWRPSKSARSRARTRVKSTPPVMSRWVRQLPVGSVCWLMRCFGCRCWACLGRPAVLGRWGRAARRCCRCRGRFLPKGGRRGCW